MEHCYIIVEILVILLIREIVNYLFQRENSTCFILVRILDYFELSLCNGSIRSRSWRDILELRLAYGHGMSASRRKGEIKLGAVMERTHTSFTFS